MLGPFRVGERPADALNLTITRPGDDQPLSGFTQVEAQLRLPDGTIQAMAASKVEPNIVQADWTGPFTQVGMHRIRAKLTGGNAVELTGWVRFWVRPA